MLIRKAFRDLCRSPESFWLRLVSIVFFCTGLSIFAGTAQTLEITTNAQVSEHWRGAYDLLIRPEQSVSAVERSFGLVEGNYLGSATGGITREQYELIKNMPDVEVAAPIATAGYVLNNTGSIGLTLKNYQRNSLYWVQTSLSSNWKGSDPITKQGISYFAAPENLVSPDIFATGPWLRDVIGVGKNDVYLSLGNLPVLWTLVAGIDPEQEARLVGIDHSIMSGSYLPEDGALKDGMDPLFNRKARKIPLLINQRPFLDMNVSMQVKTLPLSSSAAIEQLKSAKTAEEFNRVMAGLGLNFASPGVESVLNQSVNLDQSIQPLNSLAVTFSSQGEPIISDNGSFSGYDRNVLLYPGSIQYQKIDSPQVENNESVFQVVEQGRWGEWIGSHIQSFGNDHYSPDFLSSVVDVAPESPVFRPLTAQEPPPFMFSIQGIYDIGKLNSAQDPLTYVPLGIYEPPLAVLRYDTNGNPVNPERITPDLNPGGFVPRPPLALTTLEGVEYLRGQKDFIDAIRVRVRDIPDYSPENKARVERVASQIAEMTKLHVDIVAGSSPQKVMVLVPRLGYVEEQWTTIGAANKVQSGLNLANLVLFGCVLLSTLIYLGNNSQIYVLSRWQEIGLLKAAGWRNRHVFWLLTWNALILAAFTTPVTAFFSLVVTFALGLKPVWSVIWGVSIAAPFVYGGAALVPIYFMTKQNVIGSVRNGERIPLSFFQKIPIRFNLLGLAFRHIIQNAFRSLLCIVAFASSTGLLLVLVSIIVSLNGSLQVTLLGEYISLQIRAYHYMMIVIGLVMAVIVTLESVLLGIVERSNEFTLLYSLGWNSRHVARLILWEGLALGFIGGILGLPLGIILTLVLSGRLPDSFWLISMGTICGATLLGGLSAIYPVLRAKKFLFLNNPANNHSKQSTVPEQNPKRSFLWYGLGAFLIITLLLFSNRNLRRHLDETYQGFSTLISDLQIIHSKPDEASGKNIVDHIKNLVQYTPRNMGSSEEHQAADYIAHSLQSMGLKVDREYFPLTALAAYPADQKSSTLVFPNQQVQLNAIAVHSAGVNLENPITNQLIFIPAGTQYPPVESIQGKIVVLEEKTPKNSNNLLVDFINSYGSQAPYLAVASISLEDTFPGRKDLEQNNLMGSIPVSENIIGTIEGTNHTDQEILMITHYDSQTSGAEADEAASGVGVILELARMFASNPPSETVKFLVLSGTVTGLDGVRSYLVNHEDELPHIKAVIDIEKMGLWSSLQVGDDLNAPGPNKTALSPEEIEDIRNNGLKSLDPFWTRQINLDQRNRLDAVNQRSQIDRGFVETPKWLIETSLQVGQRSGIPIHSSFSPACTSSHLMFLYRSIPSVILCGEGNELAGTQYDELETLQAEKLRLAAVFTYQLIKEIAENK